MTQGRRWVGLQPEGAQRFLRGVGVWAPLQEPGLHMGFMQPDSRAPGADPPWQRHLRDESPAPLVRVFLAIISARKVRVPALLP